MQMTLVAREASYRKLFEVAGRSADTGRGLQCGSDHASAHHSAEPGDDERELIREARRILLWIEERSVVAGKARFAI